MGVFNVYRLTAVVVVLLVMPAGPTGAQIGTFEKLTVGPPACDRFLVDHELPNPPDWSGHRGTAGFVFQPCFNVLNRRTVGVWVEPQLGALVDPSSYLTAYNLKIGTSEHPIPAGVKGIPNGYAANIDTAQTKTDQAGPDGSMGYGSTIVTRGGAGFVSNAAAVLVANTPADGYGFNFGLFNDAPGGWQVGFHAGSWGRYPGHTAFKVTGPWQVGLDLIGKPVVGAGAIIGAPGGMTFYSGPQLIRFRSTSADQMDRVSIDTVAGSVKALGNVAAAAIVLKAPGGTCFRVTVGNAGGLVTGKVACP